VAALAGKTVVLGISGGISAYKAAELCRLLRKADAAVRVVMTRAACEFITPLTLQALSGHPVARELFDPVEESQIGHIRLADDADIVVIAPATADVIARLAAGLADDLLAAVVLATRAKVVLAPAMNVNMWENPLTQDNLKRLLATGRFITVGPDRGELACGWIGAGRLVDPAEILDAVVAEVTKRPATGALAGRKVVVTAGPTREAVDDVRYLGNRSSGKMGFALATAAAELGAAVTLVAGPVALATPAGLERRVDVESAAEMQHALLAAASDADVVVMAAAVADFRPAERVAGKLSRRRPPHGKEARKGERGDKSDKAEPFALALAPNPDLLSELGHRRRGDRPVLIGFAAEVGVTHGELVGRAAAKLTEKACDVIIANDVGTPGLGFGSDSNAVTVVHRDGSTAALGPAPKAELAVAIWGALLPKIFAPPAPAPEPAARPPRTKGAGRPRLRALPAAGGRVGRSR
jgi:phosphopantothenoylcysteine decarboxylase/phosphopantothenate--cysteine ligase